MNSIRGQMLSGYLNQIPIGSVRTFIVSTGTVGKLVMKKVSSRGYVMGLLERHDHRTASNLPNSFWHQAVIYDSERLKNIIMQFGGIMNNGSNTINNIRNTKNARRTGNFRHTGTKRKQ